jgi:hypothetical protein
MYSLKRDDVFKIKLIDKLKDWFLFKKYQHDILRNVEFQI